MPILRLFWLLLPACLTLLLPDCALAAVTLAKAQQPLATIVIDTNASPQVREAAKTLQDYIRASTGATLPIRQGEGAGPTINVGETPRTRKAGISPKALDEDGFILQTLQGQHIVILGGSDWGTEFGVYEFLERYLGVRWLMPTELGTDIPTHKTLSVDIATTRVTPVYLSRQLSPIDITTTAAPTSKWARFNRARGRIAFHHNMINLFPAEKYKDSAPSFYPVINGKRYLPADKKDYNWQPNLSAPGISEAAISTIDAFFDANPNAESYSLGMNDSNNWDQSEDSRKRRKGKKNYLGFDDVSDDYFLWANTVVREVSKQHPGKYFGTLAYNGVAEPPATVRLEPGIVPFITYDRMQWADPARREKNRELTKQWEKQAPALGSYDYIYGMNYLLPRVYFHQMQEYLAWGAAHHASHYYGELYPNWGEGPKPWLLTKLLWNPEQDVDALLDDWYQHFAGKKAAPALKAFYAQWEDFWTRRILTSRWYPKDEQYLPFHREPSYLLDVTITDLNRADDLINQASKLAATEAQIKRMRKLQEMWQVYKLSVVAYQAWREDFPNGPRTRDEARAAAARYQPGQAAKMRQQLLGTLQQDPLHGTTAGIILKYPSTSGANWQGN